MVERGVKSIGFDGEDGRLDDAKIGKRGFTITTGEINCKKKAIRPVRQAEAKRDSTAGKWTDELPATSIRRAGR
jgi:hypothetical protein